MKYTNNIPTTAALSLFKYQDLKNRLIVKYESNRKKPTIFSK